MKLSTIIKNTREKVPGYFESCLAQRLDGGAGSRYNFSSAEELEAALTSAEWMEATHASVMPGCRAYTAPIPGRMGIVPIKNLPEDAVLTAADPKGTGKVELTIAGQLGPETDQSWAIVGEEDGVDVLYTFHPGEPIAPSVLGSDMLPAGSTITKAEALRLGFVYAKIA